MGEGKAFRATFLDLRLTGGAMKTKKMPRSKTRQNSEQPHHIPPHYDFTSAEYFEREVGKRGGRIADLPDHWSKRRPT